MVEKKKGRPVKAELPETNLDELTDNIGNSVVSQPSNLGDTAYGLATLASGQQVLVRIKYNPVSGDTGAPEITVVGTDRFDAEERLKIVLSQELLR